jgi:hypothetical protein
MPGLEDSPIHAPPEVLDETAEEAGVGLSHHERGIENNDSFGHGSSFWD